MATFPRKKRQGTVMVPDYNRAQRLNSPWSGSPATYNITETGWYTCSMNDIYKKYKVSWEVNGKVTVGASRAGSDDHDFGACIIPVSAGDVVRMYWSGPAKNCTVHFVPAKFI